MGTAIFDIDDRLRQIIYTAAAKHEPLLLVHDQGVYLMAQNLRDPAKEGSALCAYAKGCDPAKDADDWWDNARAICGGDDFGEELNARDIAIMTANAKTLRVRFSETHMTMTAA